MPTRRLDVFMDGTPAGAVSMSDQGTLSFDYDPAYTSSPEPTPLSLSMPHVVGQHRQRVVLPFLKGLLPDNYQALDAMAATYRVSARSPFALLSHVGRDVAGALQLLPPGEESNDAVADRAALTPVPDDEVEADLAAVIDVYRSGRALPAGGPLRLSLAGAQPKIALVRTPDGHWARPVRGAPTTHILKPEHRTPRTRADERFPDLTLVELFSMAVARRAGLRTPAASTWLSPSGDLRALVVERYDRAIDADGVVHRVHQEDLCQALAVSPEKKYQHVDGGPGVGAVGELVRLRIPAQDAPAVARDFLALLTLNIALVNTDAHAKNYSLLLTGGRVRLAPAYDVLSAALYGRPEDGEPVFPMSIGGDFRVASALPERIAREGERLGLGTEEAVEVVDGVLAALPGALEGARTEVADVPGGSAIADRVITNLRARSPLHRSDGAILLSSGWSHAD